MLMCIRWMPAFSLTSFAPLRSVTIGAPCRLVYDFDVAPANSAPPAGAESFEHGFFFRPNGRR